MSRYDPWELARIKLAEYKSERDADEMTWIEAEKITEAYEELEERVNDVAQDIAEEIHFALENSIHWQLDSVLVNNEEDPHGVVETKLLFATLEKLMECYTPAK